MIRTLGDIHESFHMYRKFHRASFDGYEPKPCDCCGRNPGHYWDQCDKVQVYCDENGRMIGDCWLPDGVIPVREEEAV